MPDKYTATVAPLDADGNIIESETFSMTASADQIALNLRYVADNIAGAPAKAARRGRGTQATSDPDAQTTI